MKERDASWDFVKTILMFFVVFGHICPAGEDWTPVTRVVGLYAIPLFFLVSGYFQSQVSSATALADKMKKTFKRIVVPMMAWGLVYVMLSAMKLFPMPDSFSLPAMTASFHSLVGFLKYTPYYILGFYWFLTALLMCIVTGSLLSWLIVWRRPVGLLAVVLSVVLFCLFSPSIMEHYHFSFIWLFYAMGMLLRHVGERMSYYNSKKFVPILFLLLLMVVVWLGSSFSPEKTFYYTENTVYSVEATFIVMRYALYVLASVVVLYWLLFAYRRNANNRYIVKLADYGRDTLFIYCSHMLFLEFVHKPYLSPMLHQEHGTIWTALAEHAAGLILAIVLYAVLQRICTECKKFKFCRACFMGC